MKIITPTRDEIMQRVQAGEKLRWVTRAVSGIKPLNVDPKGQMRDCMLGRDRLSDNSSYDVVSLKREGLLIERNDGPLCFYDLPSPPAQGQGGGR